MDNCTNLHHVYAGYNISNYKKSGRISDSEWYNKDFLIFDPWQSFRRYKDLNSQTFTIN